MAWLLDTNILSELRRPRPDQNVVSFIAACPSNELYVSVITLAELRSGIEQLVADPGKRAELTDWLAQRVRPMFGGRMLEVNEDILLRGLLLQADRRKAGYTFSLPDLLIAATALQRGLTVVTRDRSPFDQADVPVLDPWKPVKFPTQ